MFLAFLFVNIQNHVKKSFLYRLISFRLPLLLPLFWFHLSYASIYYWGFTKRKKKEKLEISPMINVLIPSSIKFLFDTGRTCKLQAWGSNPQPWLCGCALHHFSPFPSCFCLSFNLLDQIQSTSYGLRCVFSQKRISLWCSMVCITSGTVTAPLSVLGGTSI